MLVGMNDGAKEWVACQIASAFPHTTLLFESVLAGRSCRCRVGKGSAGIQRSNNRIYRGNTMDIACCGLDCWRYNDSKSKRPPLLRS